MKITHLSIVMATGACAMLRKGSVPQIDKFACGGLARAVLRLRNTALIVNSFTKAGITGLGVSSGL